MDEEDIRDSQNRFKISRVYDSRFKINFLWVFVVCIVLMISDQIMKYLDFLPELFIGADYVFHILQSGINICSQLSVSVAAAVIFYYVLEFINAKKKIHDIFEIRKHMLFILYKHMNVVCYTASFDKLNRDKRRLIGAPKMFLAIDIPIFLECYEDIDREKFENELNNCLFEVHNDAEKKRILMLYVEETRKEIERLVQHKRFSFYKGYMQDIEGLKSLYEEIDQYATLYESQNNTEYFKFLVDYYITFLDDCVHIYHIMERYTVCLEDKHIFEFMKMLD